MKNMKTNLIGITRANGTYWCYPLENSKYDPVALVTNNGTIIWQKTKESLNAEERGKILKCSFVEKKKIRYWRNELRKTEKLLNAVVENSSDYYNLIDNLFWYKDALEKANAS